MIRMFVRHDVEDFGAWKHAYDEFDEERNAMGVRGDGVYRSLENPNNVTIRHDFDSEADGQAFVGSDRLKEAMVAAGVRGEPSIWFTSQA